jgi:heavy metal sensor kinase
LDFDVRASGSLFHARVAVPVDDFAEALGAFRQFLWWSIPLLLAGASLGGYGLSRRALRPVEAISRAARAINPRHLGARLRVPPARDELRALTETLNGMLERIESAFQRITQFTADASHELRSPVALMRTTAEITLRQPRAESEYRAALNTILAEAEATSSLLEQLMLLARADSGFEAMRREPLDLARALQAAARRVEGAAASKRIAIEIRVPAGPVWVEGDAGALSRLFTILLDNAIKFSPPAAPVGIELGEDSGAAIAEIRDEGIGIAAEDLPMIFDRFFQADKARTRGARGAGLGLSIGRWIAEAHGGAITVESVPGRGSSFRVRIPLAAPNPV